MLLVSTLPLSAVLQNGPLTFAASLLAPPPVYQTTVGLPMRMEQVVLPGSLLEAKPISDRKQPLVVRVVASYQHGNAHRYDLEVYGLEEGDYDVTEYLQRVDGQSFENPTPLLVRVSATLPPGHVVPHAITPQPGPRLGGYRTALIVGAVVWLLGLAMLLWNGRQRRLADIPASPQPPTVADRLRPLVRAAMNGTITSGQRAELERVLLAYWCRKLKLTQHRPAEVMATLRAHPEAGKLIGHLENWLHRPDATKQSTDLESLLAVYQDVREEPDEPGSPANLLRSATAAEPITTTSR
jgi:hypothetical protein